MLPETLTLHLSVFQIKICDFSYPISHLIKNLIPCFRPDPHYTVVINIKRGMVLSRDEEVASSKKIPNSRSPRVHKPYPISDQNGQNRYPISDQNG